MSNQTSQRTPEQEAEFLRGKREELSAAQDELQRAKDTLQKMEAKLEGFERVKAEAERRGADDRELADIEAREQALQEKAERGRVWIPERQKELADAERAIESRERRLQQDRGQGRDNETSPDASPDTPSDGGADTGGRDEGGGRLRSDPQVLDAREHGLDAREKKLDEREAAVAARERTLDGREAELTRQEDRLNARERATDPEPGPESPEPTSARSGAEDPAPKDNQGPLRDGEEVAAYQRLRREGMSPQFARAEIIDSRKDAPRSGRRRGG